MRLAKRLSLCQSKTSGFGPSLLSLAVRLTSSFFFLQYYCSTYSLSFSSASSSKLSSGLSSSSGSSSSRSDKYFTFSNIPSSSSSSSSCSSGTGSTSTSSSVRMPTTTENEITIEHKSPFLRPKQPKLKQQSKEDDDFEKIIVLIVLNSPIRQPPSPLFRQLWNLSSYRVCADGGANRLYDSDKELLPDLIRGDLDSLRSHVRTYYLEQQTKIEQDPDQNTNDLDKALQAVVKKYCQKRQTNGSTTTATDTSKPPLVCVYGAFGGRFDQEMASMQALYKWSETFQYRLILYDDYTSAFLLPSGVKNTIRLPFHGEHCNKDDTARDMLVVGEGPTCGLIPLGGRCESVITTGLKWDLDGQTPLEFGGLVSTSNHIMEPVVTVQSSHPLIFTAEMTDGT